MLNKEQLEFLKSALCAKGVAIPADEGAKTVRLYLSTLDEVESQLKLIESATDKGR